MSKKTTPIIFAAITSLFALTTVANAESIDPAETAATREACNGKSDGDSCNFVRGDKTITGTCDRGEDGKTTCIEQQK